MSKYFHLLLFILLYNSLDIAHPYDYDHIIIGGGTAGLAAAKALQTYKKKVALIEKDEIGGTKIWNGDIPTKMFIKVANTARQINESYKLGIPKISLGTFSIAPIFEYIKDTIKKVQQIDLSEYLAKADYFRGIPQFIDDHTIEFDSKKLSAETFIIATGSHPYIPPIPGIETIDYLTPQNFFNQSTLPDQIAIIGGGPLGTEMSMALAKLGIKVTLILKYTTPLPTFDRELVSILVQDIKNLGVTIEKETEVTKIERISDSSKRIRLHLRSNDTEYSIETKGVFIALNRVPNTKSLNLNDIGVAVEKNAIKVSSSMQSSVSHIYACGDVIGGSYLFNRVAYYQAKIAAYNSCRNYFEPSVRGNYAFVSKIIFSEPPIASVGLTETAARSLYGDSVKVYHCSYNQIDRAYIDEATNGIGKFVCQGDGTLIGIHIYGKPRCTTLSSVMH